MLSSPPRREFGEAMDTEMNLLLASDAAIHSSTPGQFVSTFATYP